MIITMIFVVLLVVGIILKLLKINPNFDDVIYICIMIGMMGSIACLIIILGTHSDTQNYINKAKLEYDGLVAQVECIKHNYSNISKEDVIKKVVNWNDEVDSQKENLQNPWISWFYDKKYIDSLEHIDIESLFETEDKND